MKEVEVVKKAMLPLYYSQPLNDPSWLVFSYGAEDIPYKWPKVIKYDGKFFKWMSYNSDNFHVNYKECAEKEIAFPVKK
jgi:hypothetical protein